MKVLLVILAIFTPGVCCSVEKINLASITHKYPENFKENTDDFLKNLGEARGVLLENNMQIDQETGKIKKIAVQKRSMFAGNSENYIYLQSISTSQGGGWSIILNNLSISSQSAYKKIGNLAEIIKVQKGRVVVKLTNPDVSKIAKNKNQNGNKVYSINRNGLETYYLLIGVNEIFDLENYLIMTGNMAGVGHYIART